MEVKIAFIIFLIFRFFDKRIDILRTNEETSTSGNEQTKIVILSN